jgi:anhydro-N-acetylmuramic acid kinase
MLTVKSICMAINNFDTRPNLILFSGGGRKNEFIIENIQKILKRPIHLIDEYNFNGDFIESQAFAYLSIRSYLKKIISLPETTGVKKPCLGGVIFKTK